PGILVLLVVLALSASLGRSALTSRQSGGQPLPVGGRLAVPTDAGLQVYSLDERRLTPIVPTAQGEVITSAAWAPDGKTVAYALFHRRSGDPASVSEIYVADADGSQARPVAERERAGDILDTPVWTVDGREIVFAFYGQVAGKSVQRIDRVSVE